MGCHTWFKVPRIIGKEDIIQLAREYVNTCKYLTDSYREMYLYAISNELIDPLLEIASYQLQDGCSYHHGWILYTDISKHSVIEYNKVHGTDYKNSYDMPKEEMDKLESYSDEPRIGGYPEIVIHSCDEMVSFMESGYTDEEGKHFDFYYEEDRKSKFMEGIKTFFIRHPDGIIIFG